MNVTNGDVVWSYIAQFFNVATGIIVLPMILRLLNTEEIAFYYVILNIGTLVNLFDFGFSAQFSRNFAYLFSGAQELQKEGLSNNVGGEINYKLLKVLINTAATVYRVISLIIIVMLLSFGSLYMRRVTDNFTTIDNSFILWILYSVSVFFNMYFMYINQMVMGKGLIRRNQQSIIASRVVYLVICFVMLNNHFGLFSIVIANMCSPFISRTILSFSFYDKTLKKELKKVTVTNTDKKECFSKIWFNAKKVGIAALGAFGIQKSSMFFAGLFLMSKQIASFGLLQQFSNITIGLSVTLFNSFTPRIASHCVEKNEVLLKNDFSLCVGAFLSIFIFLSGSVITLGPIILKFLGSNATLPSHVFMFTYFLVQLLEQNHSIFASLIALNNRVPYVKPSLISGGVIVVALYISLRFFNAGIWALVIVPGIVQLAYNNWKWPKEVCKNILKVNYFYYVFDSVLSFFYYLVNKIFLKKKGL